MSASNDDGVLSKGLRYFLHILGIVVELIAGGLVGALAAMALQSPGSATVSPWFVFGIAGCLALAIVVVRRLLADVPGPGTAESPALEKRERLAARAVPLRADLAAADDRSRATSSAPSEQMTRDEYKASRIGIFFDVVIRLGSGAVVAYAVTQLGQPKGAVRAAVWLLAAWMVFVAFDAIWRNRWSPSEEAALRQDAELKQRLLSHLEALDASPERGAQYVSLSDLERILDERGVRRRKPWWKARSRRAR